MTARGSAAADYYVCIAAGCNECMRRQGSVENALRPWKLTFSCPIVCTLAFALQLAL